MTVNMAGALVKSIFPEMDRKPTEAPTPAPTPPPQSSEIRRAPINPLISSMDGYSRKYSHEEHLSKKNTNKIDGRKTTKSEKSDFENR